MMQGSGVRGQGSRKRRVVLTQSRGRLEGLGEVLEQQGYTITHQPLIETKPLLDEMTIAKTAKLLDYKWILFTSRTAARVWKALNPLPPTSYFLLPKFGAIGKKTAETLKTLGIKVSLIAEKENAENFAEMFLRHPEASSPVGLPQGDRALNTLQKKLEQHNFEVHPVVIYKTILKPRKILDADVILLASPSAVEALENYGEAKLVAIGETTCKAIQARGWQAVHSPSPDVTSILEVITMLNREETV